MPSTTTYRRGDIVLVAFPFTDLSATKQRPALVLQSNPARSDVLVAAITSQLPPAPAPDEFRIPIGDLKQCGLPKPSIVRLMKLVCLHERLVTKRIGYLPPPTLAVLLGHLRNLF